KSLMFIRAKIIIITVNKNYITIMPNQQVVDYITQQRSFGRTKEEIIATLEKSGWQADEIEADYVTAVTPTISSSQPTQTITTKPSTTISMPNEGGKKKKLLWLWISLAVVLISILAGGGAFAYYYFFPTPETVIKRMIANMRTIAAIEYKGNITVDATTPALPSPSSIMMGMTEISSTTQDAKLSINFSGANEKLGTSTVNNRLALEFGYTASPKPVQELGFEEIFLNNILYLNLTKIPDLGMFDASPIKNQWIKIDIAALIKQFGLEKYTDEYKNKLEEAKKKNELTTERKLKLKQLAIDSKIFSLGKTLPEEIIDGVLSRHYAIKIDKIALKKYIIDASGVMDKKYSAEELISIQKGLDSVDFSEMQIWIGKKDYFLHRFSFGVSITNQEFKSKGNIAVDIHLMNYNQQNLITVPEKYVSVEELIGKYMMNMIGTGVKNEIASTTGEFGKINKADSQMDNDADGLKNYEEDLIGTDKNKADSDGDGYTDGAEVDGGFNPLGLGKSTDSYVLGRMKSKNTLIISEVKQLQNALEMYYADNMTYPETSQIGINGSPDGVKGLTSSMITYMSAIPKSPAQSNYRYSKIGTGEKASYTLEYWFMGDYNGETSGTATLSGLGI
ncbi:MAG: type II secretion system protein GspG, partial [Candidatus Falkowbacteria bacterium]